MLPTSRIRQIASHVVAAVEAEAEEELHIDEYIARHGHTQQQRGNRGPEQAEFTKRLKEMPRVDKDIATWSNAELMRRGLALGASDEQISDIVASTDSRAELLALVSSLEPPPPSTATVDQITVDARTATIEEMGEILERVGAVVITNAAPLELMDALDAQLEEAGAWNISRGKQVNGRPAGRMQMNMLLKAPLTQELVTNEYVTGVTRHVLGPHCKRIALKELSEFWPWHHEPDAWSTNLLCVLKIYMPRGSVLLFTGGLIHGSGVNSTNVGRKSLLSSFQLGWLRPEYKFWAHKELHNALSDGKMKPELTELMGHLDNPHPADSEWGGNIQEGMYLGRFMDQVDEDEPGSASPKLSGSHGYEMAGSGGSRRTLHDKNVSN